MRNPLLHSNGRDLRAGDWVEVRSRDSILATLDERGRLEALPFMPEMLQHTGKRFKVYKVAHKTCDTIETYKGRRMTNAVHLEGLRCDGEAHGGCQAQCLLFWKEAWLTRVSGPEGEVAPVAEALRAPMRDRKVATKLSCDLAALNRNTLRQTDGGSGETYYTCQATELVRATSPLSWWEPWSYFKDITSGNVRPSAMIRYMGIATFNILARFILRWIVRPRAWVHPYPYMRGLAVDKVPTEVLNLQPGELVEVRSKPEIMRTLNKKLRNRGLSFDTEFVQYCGKKHRVRSRVNRIINEKTGAMMELASDCIILDGATCSGNFSSNRMFCPRSVYPYWREIWLKRVKE
jgi:hypothetical protein